ncbi:MAG: CesT family type III secretion system chaperone [Ramlibacter sp.]
MPGSFHALQPLLTALSAALGQQVGLDRHGECALAFDDDVEIVIAPTPEADLLTIRCAVTAAGQVMDTRTLRGALGLNHAHLPPGYALSLDTDTPSGCDQLMLLAVLPSTGLPADALVHHVEGFVALVPELRAQLRAQPAAARPDSMLLHSLGV